MQHHKAFPAIGKANAAVGVNFDAADLAIVHLETFGMGNRQQRHLFRLVLLRRLIKTTSNDRYRLSTPPWPTGRHTEVAPVGSITDQTLPQHN